LRGAQLVQETFEEVESKMLHGAIIWTPMLANDGLNAAEVREAIFPDSRVGHYWDPDRIFGQMLSRTLYLHAPIAWDVYLAYPPEHLWHTDLPPSPKFWMHQLDEEPTLLLDPTRFKRAVKRLLVVSKISKFIPKLIKVRS